MKRLVLISAIFLSGCLTTTKIPKWPDVPKDMLEACPDLKPVDQSNTKISELLGIVTDNYQQYYNCKSTTDDWILWYKEQKKIRDSFQ